MEYDKNKKPNPRQPENPNPSHSIKPQNSNQSSNPIHYNDGPSRVNSAEKTHRASYNNELGRQTQTREPMDSHSSRTLNPSKEKMPAKKPPINVKDVLYGNTDTSSQRKTTQANAHKSTYRASEIHKKIKAYNVSSQDKSMVKRAVGKTTGVVSKTAAITTKTGEVLGHDQAAYKAASDLGKHYVNRKLKKAGFENVSKVSKGLSHAVTTIQDEDGAKVMFDASSKIALKGVSKTASLAQIEKRAKAKNEKRMGKSKDKLDEAKDKQAKLQKKANKEDKKLKKANKKPEKTKKVKKRTRKADKANKRLGKSNKRVLKRQRKNDKVIKRAQKKMKFIKGAKKLILKILIPPAAILMFSVIIGAFISGSGGAIGVIFSKFASSVCDFASMEWTAPGIALEKLENMNWAQYIADDTCVSLGNTFIDAAKKDSQSFYSSKKITIADAIKKSGDDGKPIYNWYCDLGEGSIGNTWMREQCDNITDKNGVLVYDSNGKVVGDTSNKNLLYTPGGYLQQMDDDYGYPINFTYTPNATKRVGLTPNANIVPILSLAHDRYTDEWNWENYVAVEAYVWYMYALSHNVAHYDSNAKSDGAYSYENQQRCDNGMFSAPTYLNQFKYDMNSHILTRPGFSTITDKKGVTSVVTNGTTCSNVYVHGYNKEDLFNNSTVATVMKEKTRGTAKKVLSFIDGIFKAAGADTNLSSSIAQAGTYTISYTRGADGLYHGGPVTATMNGVSKTYNSIVEAKAILGIDTYADGHTGTCDNVQYRQLDNHAICGVEAHKHGDGTCVPCTLEEHKHGKDCDTKNCKHVCTAACFKFGCKHVHDATCCSKTEHKHSKVNCCPKAEHKHAPWVSVENPGCYDTFAYCAGHCGGHIKPTVNVAITYTMEGLAYQDAITMNAEKASKNGSKPKEASFMSNSDFRGLYLNLLNVGDLQEWSKLTLKKGNTWFSPGPNGPLSAICWAGETYGKTYLKVFKAWRDWWKSLAGDEEPGYSDPASGSNGSIPDSEKGEDDFEFTGWFDDSGKKFNPELMQELHDLYGVPDDFYKLGVETWGDFEVHFQVGYGKTYSPQQIAEIIADIQAKYPDISNERVAVLEEGLRSCGMYKYELSGPAHFNGMYQMGGLSECTGFVSGVYMRSLGSKCGFWFDVMNTYVSPGTGEKGAGGKGVGDGGIWHEVAGKAPSGPLYAHDQSYMGNRPSGIPVKNFKNLRPGDVLLSPYASPQGGHAIIFAGYYKDSTSGTTGYWIIDCSGSADGSSYRVIPDAHFEKNYTLMYSPFNSFGVDKK